jgi:hypothetical protein
MCGTPRIDLHAADIVEAAGGASAAAPPNRAPGAQMVGMIVRCSKVHAFVFVAQVDTLA